MKNNELSPLAQNIKMLSRWDDRKVIRSMGMGGMGDSYEMPIQRLAVESLRAAIEDGFPDFDNLLGSEIRAWGRSVTTEVYEKNKGSDIFGEISTVQGECSVQLLFQASIVGWFSMVEMIPSGRLIFIDINGRIAGG